MVRRWGEKTRPQHDTNTKYNNIVQIQRMAIEVGIWLWEPAGRARLSTQLEQPICEALIPIQSARERNIDFWPLGPPPGSPQTRRKSLNDLLGESFLLLLLVGLLADCLDSRPTSLQAGDKSKRDYSRRDERANRADPADPPPTLAPTSRKSTPRRPAASAAGGLLRRDGRAAAPTSARRN